MDIEIPLYQLLGEADVFNKVDETDRRYLASIAHEHNLKKGETLVYQGDLWHGVVYIRSGKLKWSLVTEKGKEHTFFNLDPGRIFWGHSNFDELPMPASLIPLEASIVYSWTRDQIKPVLARHPDAMWEIGKSLTWIMRRARESVVNLAFRQVTGRLAKYLLDLSDNESRQIERDLTLEELSTRLAATPQVICRLLYQLESEEILSITRAQFIIEEREKLEKLVGDA